jgi:hypothetical protein
MRHSKRNATSATSRTKNSTPETTRSVPAEGGVEVAAVKDATIVEVLEPTERYRCALEVL